MHSYAKRFRYFAVMALSFCAHNAFAQWEQITPENEVVVSVPDGGENRVPIMFSSRFTGTRGVSTQPILVLFRTEEKVITYLFIYQWRRRLLGQCHLLSVNAA